MNCSPVSRTGLAVLSIALLPLIASADLKVVSKTISQNTPAIPGGIPGAPTPSAAKKPGEPVLSTAYYKGKKVRVEEGDRVVITDNETGTIVTIDSKKKTFTTQKLADMASQVSPFTEMLEVKVDGALKPTEMKKPVAGRETRLYAGKFTMAMSVKEGAPIPLPAGDGPLMEIIIESEQWAAEGIQLDPKTQGPGFSPLPAGMMRMMPGMDSMMKKMTEIKGFPLSTAMKISFQSSLPLPGIPEKPVVIKTETVSVPEDALPDTLFAVPAGFKQVEPELPAFPGLGGGSR